MANPFETVVSKLLEIGFYDFLLFLLALPILFAILKKTKLLGERPEINGLVAFVMAFLVFSFPFITGVSLTFSLTNMAMQLMMFVFILFFAMVLASFFYPDLLGMLKEKFTSRSTISVMLAVGVTLLVISGFLPTVIGGLTGPKAPIGPTISQDIMNFVAAIIIFIVVLIIAAATTMHSS